MPQDYKANVRRNKVVGWAGSQAGQDQNFASQGEMDQNQFEQMFQQQYPGASGIAGTGVRAGQPYKDALAKAWAAFQAQAALQQSSVGAAPAGGDPIASHLMDSFGQMTRF